MDKTQGNDPTATSAWIFQGNPVWYDISRAVTEQDLLVWGVKQCSRQIARGDRVYIWASGPEGGVIARGVTLDDALSSSASCRPIHPGLLQKPNRRRRGDSDH